VRHVLDGFRAQDEPPEVVPVCPFVAQWLLRHTDYAPLVTPALRGQFEPR
jgi:predicted GNAT family acetyltransferase